MQDSGFSRSPSENQPCKLVSESFRATSLSWVESTLHAAPQAKLFMDNLRCELSILKPILCKPRERRRGEDKRREGERKQEKKRREEKRREEKRREEQRREEDTEEKGREEKRKEEINISPVAQWQGKLATNTHEHLPCQVRAT